jgi:DNA (cytosine-5)-methyltransferase 1
VKPRLLDLFCGAGGAGMGYHRAGFEVVGVDLTDQPNYPFEFHQADAMTFDLGGFDAVHASPPCQDHSVLNRGSHGTGWMLGATVERLSAAGVPWVVENVVGPKVTMGGYWFTLCGSSFGMRVRRHRRFGSSELVLSPPCRHAEQGRPFTIIGHGGGRLDSKHSMKPNAKDFWRYMDMPWMEGKPPYGVAQAIPPAYTEFIGAQLLRPVEAAAS